MIQELLQYFNPSDYLGLWLLVSFVLAFFVSFSSFPAIFKIAEAKQLMDVPDDRSVHSTTTPTLGGIGIFMSLVVVMTIVGALLDTKLLLLVLGGMTILFFLGLKDDLLILSPRKKFIGQLLIALLLVIFTDTRILGFSGIFGITVMPYWLSTVFTVFVYILVINAYNLIDGVDGLAGSIGLFASAVFAYIFVQMGDLSMATIAVALVGALLPFLRLNFSSKKKIFMGDTGSMIIGFLVAFFIVRFIGQSQMQPSSEYHNSAPVLAFAIVFFPLLDTLRIFMIRLLIFKTNPFVADKNHIHHRFIQLGFTHLKTTVCIVLMNLVVVLLIFLVKDWNIHWQFILLLTVGIILFSIFFIFNWMRKFKFGSKFLEQFNSYL
jgi:UDP-N-acetylmuramyl pentapeptide phosphotransferase/UDP-N-acetylglucosamine-1-phosphate transferase